LLSGSTSFMHSGFPDLHNGETWAEYCSSFLDFARENPPGTLQDVLMLRQRHDAMWCDVRNRIRKTDSRIAKRRVLRRLCRFLFAAQLFLLRVSRICEEAIAAGSTQTVASKST
jgi:hypothetical protein